MKITEKELHYIISEVTKKCLTESNIETKIEPFFLGGFKVYYYVKGKDKWYPYPESFKTQEEAEMWVKQKKEDRKKRLDVSNTNNVDISKYYGNGRYNGD